MPEINLHALLFTDRVITEDNGKENAAVKAGAYGLLVKVIVILLSYNLNKRVILSAHCPAPNRI